MFTSVVDRKIAAPIVTSVPPLRDPALGPMVCAASDEAVNHDIAWLLVEKSRPLLLTSTTSEPLMPILCSATTHLTNDELTNSADAVSSAAPNLHTKSREPMKCCPTTVTTCSEPPLRALE
eukprot:2037245-Rhodomonas_salina.1